MAEDGLEIVMEEFDVTACVRVAMQNTLPCIDLSEPTTSYVLGSLVMDILDDGVPVDEDVAQQRFSELIYELNNDSLDKDDIRCVCPNAHTRTIAPSALLVTKLFMLQL
jgi:hypothetical protein